MSDTTIVSFRFDNAIPWRVVAAREDVEGHACEDDCIVDANGKEVIGSSEWMRGSEHLPFIVDCVNRCAVVADLVAGEFSQRARLGYLLDALKFDEQLNGSNPKRSTLDFPHAIQIVEAAIAALDQANSKP